MKQDDFPTVIPSLSHIFLHPSRSIPHATSGYHAVKFGSSPRLQADWIRRDSPASYPTAKAPLFMPTDFRQRSIGWIFHFVVHPANPYAFDGRWPVRRQFSCNGSNSPSRLIHLTVTRPCQLHSLPHHSRMRSTCSSVPGNSLPVSANKIQSGHNPRFRHSMMTAVELSPPPKFIPQVDAGGVLDKPRGNNDSITVFSLSGVPTEHHCRPVFGQGRTCSQD